MLQRSDLYTYQANAVEFVKRTGNCALWVDMGLGKTVIAATAFADLVNSFDARRMLVCAPLRVARDVWADEVETWAHLNGLTTARLIGTAAEAEAGLRVPADIHLINRERLAWLETFFIEQVSRYKYRQYRRWPWDVMCLDESQSFKHQSSSRWQSADRLIRFLKPMVWELTGTPAPNGYSDLWGQIHLLDQGKRLGRSEDAFKQRWFHPAAEGEYAPRLKDTAPAEIQAAVADIVLSMRAEDYLDLPPVIFNPVKVKLPPQALDAYKKFERSSAMQLKGFTITAVNAGVLSRKLLQAANGALYTGDGREYETFHDEKVKALLEILEGLAGPVVIGYSFKHDLARIGAALDKEGKRWSLLKSAESMKAFRSGRLDRGVIHPASGGHGLNDLHLSGSENLVWFSPIDNLELWDQLNARLVGGHRRKGKNVVIHCIVADDTADFEALELLKRKENVQTALARALVKNHI